MRGALTVGVAEDWEFALRASLRFRLHFENRPVFAYRRHAASITTAAAADCAEANVPMLEDFVGRHPELIARHLSALHEYRGFARGLGES
jgi:hypothetical protein